jgi:hypothetical protein
MNLTSYAYVLNNTDKVNTLLKSKCLIDQPITKDFVDYLYNQGQRINSTNYIRSGNLTAQNCLKANLTFKNET